MIRSFGKKILAFQMFTAAGVIAQAGTAEASGNNFSSIAQNIADSIEELPGLLASLAYLVGMLMGVLGVLKLKDHVENPTQTPMKEGAIRLAVGGALFALPMLFESMQNTIGTTNAGVGPATLNRATFSVN